MNKLFPAAVAIILVSGTAIASAPQFDLSQKTQHQRIDADNVATVDNATLLGTWKIARAQNRRELPPLDTTLPDAGTCTMESGVFCRHECRAGYGKKYDIYSNCEVILHDVCTPTTECGSNGPIEDLDDELQTLPG